MFAPLLLYALDAPLPPDGSAPSAEPANAPMAETAPPRPEPEATTATMKEAGAPVPPKTLGELQVALGIAGGTSDWSGDPLGYGALRIGLRLFRVVGPFVEGRLGYGRVDQRMLTFLSIGVEGGVPIRERFFPRGWVGFVHQHEESLASVADAPFGALLGIGGGIRHRAGVQMGLGFDFVLRRGAKYELTIGPEATAVYLTYSSGPSWYGLVGAVARGNFRLF